MGFVSGHDRLACKTGNASKNFSANAVNHYEVPMVTPTPRPRPDAAVFEIAFVPVYFDQLASHIVNIDHSIMGTW